MITRDTPRPDEIPAHLWPGLVRYFVDRIRPGSFLSAVLVGDLEGAARRADPTSAEAMPALVAWLDAHAPEGSHGSPALVDAWEAGPHARR